MYTKLGYSIYRTVNKYYSSSLDSSGEDAHGIDFYNNFRYEKIFEKRSIKNNLKTYRQKNIA
jgi:hypothetical protein